MQNNTAMIAQRMMNRQAPYGPVGMVSQNMSGNKKGGVNVTNIAFDVSSTPPGVTFANNSTTVTNNTGSNIVSSKANVTTPSGYSKTYVEFLITNLVDQYVGFAIASTWVSNNTARVGFTPSSISFRITTGQVFLNSSAVLSTGVIGVVGDIIGIALDNRQPGNACQFTFYLNDIQIGTYDAQATLQSGSVFVPVWSSNLALASTTISNSIYAPPSGYVPIGFAATVVSAYATISPVADGLYDVYTFKSSGTFTVVSPGAGRTLVVAGGGGGNGTGGGGAGGYIEKSRYLAPQTYVITVGGGGGNSTQGNASAIGAAATAVGGGAGTGALATANGGSGGGASPSFAFSGAFSAAGGTGTVGQGTDGGSSSGTTTSGVGAAGGGGGGAISTGQAGTTSTGGSGGSGISSTITGSAVTRAGGGGGLGDVTPGSGGSGGGGAGSLAAGTGTAGTANTGGGGGGASANGGSGVVVIRVRARA